MKYTGYSLAFQEVPGEASLAISISNCPFKCAGCHSSYLQTDVGYELTPEVFTNIISKYCSPHTGNYTISCVVFFGGEQHHDDFITLAKLSHYSGLKVCLYTGAELVDIHPDVKFLCNYIKVGPYISNLGGLDKSTTNQRLYNLDTGVDITHKLWES